MTPSERRRWLTTRLATAPEAIRSDANAIQSLINSELLTPRVLLGEESGLDGHAGSRQSSSVDDSVARDVTALGLARAVAKEKADCLDELRPSVRAIGASRVHDLVVRIFEELADGSHEPRQVASDFGLSQPTLSRFAGTRWARDTDRPEDATIPDLWRNTAQVIASHPEFIEAASDSGTWSRIASIVAAKPRSP